MPIAIDAVLAAVRLAGSELPAFKALFDTVVDTFTETDQEKLKKAYADARARTDAAHSGLQSKLDRASKQ